MLGPGGSHSLVTVEVAGHPQQVFEGAARNLAGLYRQGMAFGERLMVVQDDLRWTYAEVFAQAAALADALRNRFGVAPGDRVAVVMGNRAEWIVSVLAITAVGGVAALVNSRGVGEEMVRAVATADCKLAILDAERDRILTGELPDPVWPRIVVGADAGSLRSGKDADFGLLSAPRQELAFEPDERAPRGWRDHPVHLGNHRLS
ncbi:long-chain fatty acid--CoA ligase [Novosphingobium sp. G106]|nr:long-chain fatty acid--CoA ligase [Novosphingobium sp. G106]